MIRQLTDENDELEPAGPVTSVRFATLSCGKVVVPGGHCSTYVMVELPFGVKLLELNDTAVP